MKFTELKEKVGAQISQSAHFYVHSMGGLDSARYYTTATSLTKPQATEGLYKRLKKEFIDVDEAARKKLTGGKHDNEKLEW